MQNLIEKYNIDFEEVSYIGDDINDIECMKKAALSDCQSDAHEDVLKISKYICKVSSGNGAVREFSDLILLNNKNYQWFISLSNICQNLQLRWI